MATQLSTEARAELLAHAEAALRLAYEAHADMPADDETAVKVSRFIEQTVKERSGHTVRAKHEWIAQPGALRRMHFVIVRVEP